MTHNVSDLRSKQSNFCWRGGKAGRRKPQVNIYTAGIDPLSMGHKWLMIIEYQKHSTFYIEQVDSNTTSRCAP